VANQSYIIAKELVGTKVGRWQILSVGENDHGNWKVLCKCDCGTERYVRASRIREGRSKSCGCLARDSLVIHGRTTRKARHTSREYWIWNSMKNRCLNNKYKHFKDYGGRGITVCGKWLTFAGFFEDMGINPNGMTLERLDNEKGYSKENCVWASRSTQNKNKRNNKYITANGETHCLTEWARKLNISHSTIIGRLDRGWPEALAVTTPKYVTLKKLHI
jgi:hypothetical protein